MILRIKNNIEFISKILFYIIAALIIAAGIYWRLKAYLNAYPLWLDEVCLVCDLLKDLFEEKFYLFLTQKTPPVFLVISHICTKIGGYNVLSYRFFAFISSIISIFLFFLLALKMFKSKIPILTGLYLFASCIPLIGYGTEFKPYSSDVFVCLLLIFACTHPHFNLNKISVKQLVLYFFLSIFFILLSFPSIFILSAILLFKVIENKTINIKVFLLALSIFITCLYLYFLYNDFRVSWEIYEAAWQDGFFKFSFDSIYNIFINFLEFLRYGLDKIKYDFIILFIIAGFFLFLIEKNKYAIIMSIIFIFACIASYFKIYPLSSRVMLYFTPIIILFLVKPLDYYAQTYKDKFYSIIKSFLLLILLLNCCNLLNINHFTLKKLDIDNISVMESPEERIACNNIITDFLKNYESKEVIIADYALKMQLLYYYRIGLLVTEDLNIIIYPEEADKAIEDCLSNNKSFWILKERYTSNNDFLNEFKEKNIKYKEYCEGKYCSYHIFK